MLAGCALEVRPPNPTVAAAAYATAEAAVAATNAAIRAPATPTSGAPPATNPASPAVTAVPAAGPGPPAPGVPSLVARATPAPPPTPSLVAPATPTPAPSSPTRPAPATPIPPPATPTPVALADLRRRAADAEATLQSGTFEAITDYGAGARAEATLRFDLGDAQRPPRLRHLTTIYRGMVGSQATEQITIGRQAWRRRDGGGWEAMTAPAAVYDDVLAYLPHLAVADEVRARTASPAASS